MSEYDKLTSLISNAMNDYIGSVTDAELIKPSEYVADYLIKHGVSLSPPNNCSDSKKCSAYCANCNRRSKEVSIK